MLDDLDFNTKTKITFADILLVVYLFLGISTVVIGLTFILFIGALT